MLQQDEGGKVWVAAASQKSRYLTLRQQNPYSPSMGL